MKVRIKDLGEGQQFVTCLTNRSGERLKESESGMHRIGVRSMLSSFDPIRGPEYKHLHPAVLVEVNLG